MRPKGTFARAEEIRGRRYPYKHTATVCTDRPTVDVLIRMQSLTRASSSVCYTCILRSYVRTYNGTGIPLLMYGVVFLKVNQVKTRRTKIVTNFFFRASRFTFFQRYHIFRPFPFTMMCKLLVFEQQSLTSNGNYGILFRRYRCLPLDDWFTKRLKI